MIVRGGRTASQLRVESTLQKIIRMMAIVFIVCSMTPSKAETIAPVKAMFTGWLK